AHECVAGRAEQEVDHDNRTADRGRQPGREVDTYRFDLAAVHGQLDQADTRTGRSAVDEAVVRDGSRDVRVEAAPRLSVAPEETASLGIDADESFLQELDVLFLPARLDNDR